MGHVVCRSAFCSLFNVTDSALVTASARIKSMGGGLPVIKRKEKHERKRKDSDKERVIIKELEYYARRYGYPSPCGKVLGGDVDEEEKELFILSSHMDKKSVWEAIMAEKGENMFSSSYFMEIWRKKARHVRIAQRGTDFCDTCCMYMRSQLEDKWSLLQHHQEKAKIEKEKYRKIIEQTNDNCDQIHFLFDFAQAICIPHERMEPKQAFFTTNFKIDLFGVTCEKQRLNNIFLLPEGSYPSTDAKSPNHVISMLDTILKNVDPNVRELYFHADNCGAQNKNKYVFGYFSYLVATGRFDTVHVMFMLQGHTKFAPDGAFGLIKRYYRRHIGIYTLPKVADAVDLSSVRNVPVSSASVAWMDWRMYLKQYGVDFPVISKMHLFNVTKEDPMTWTCFANSTHKEEDYHRHEVRIFKPCFAPIHLIDPTSFDPLSIISKGKKTGHLVPPKPLAVAKITTQRKTYLLHKLPSHVTDEAMVWWREYLDEVSET